ncbi:MAG: nucleoside hydrolase [Verrucomicrobia bacterium]|nr:nucleoside hydrolase [Verrucomicrobiota bacterium]MCH8528017.1 nucleoside hydrolase [Kiritimatiellia bacterium]
MHKHNASHSALPVSILLDTDMATDCDDAGAMAVLHALASKGEAEILGVVTNNRDGASIGAVAAINSYYGRPDIPLGACQRDDVGIEAARFVQKLAADTARYGHTVTSREQVPDAVDLYRRGLAAAPDHSVVIVSIGHLNNLAGLLDSGPDASSPLTGLELVQQKVPRLVVMGGDYPAGKEHNFWARGSAPYTARVLETWPGPILFTGYSLGESVMTGPAMAGLPEDHPVRRAYAGHSSQPLERGRPSWDQTAVLAAVRGPAPYWTLSPPGRNVPEADGSNHWENDPEGNHVYLVESMPPSGVARVISQLMVHEIQASE